MIRARFHANDSDYRPIKWPYPHPFWCTGYGDNYSIVVAYADNEDQILEYWPEATEIDSDEAQDYLFSDRFPKPEWLN